MHCIVVATMSARRVDLSDEDARSLFSQNILRSTAVADLFAYKGSLKFKKRPLWSEILVHRTLLNDAFTYSCGHALNQRSLQQQLEAFFSSLEPPVQFMQQDVEGAIYRLRCMMSQLRYAKRDCGLKAVPKGCESLSALMEKVCVDVQVSRDGQGQVSVSESSVEALPAETKMVETIVVSDPEFDFSEAQDDVGSMLAVLFDTPEKLPKPTALPSSRDPAPTPTALPSSSARMSLDEIDNAIGGELGLIIAEGPTAKQYTTVFKRPAGKSCKVKKKPCAAAGSPKGEVKRVYSRAYHKEVCRCKGMHLTAEQIKIRARRCGQKAVASMC